MRAGDELREMLRRNALRLERARALRRPVVHVAIDVGGGGVLIPAAPRRTEVRPRVVDPRPDLLPVVAPLPGRHHTVGIVLAGREGRRDSVREEDEWVVCPLVTPEAVGAEGHVVVRVHVEEAGHHILIVAEWNDARTLGLRRGNRAIHSEDTSGDDEYSLI